MRSFFDPMLLDQGGEAFIREEKLDEALLRLVPGARITKGGFSYPGRAEQRDLVWNHMDQNHRPFIHRTYGEAMRVSIGTRSAFSLTRFGNWPIVIPVYDGYFKENGFYQIMCLFGLFVVVNVIECKMTDEGTRMDIRWAIASHRFLRFLHPMLDRKLHKLNVVQNAEDDEIRYRRVELRAAGYRFGTDNPDFVKSNAVGNNVVFPAVADAHAIELSSIAEGQPQRVDVANRAFIVRRDKDSVEVWPGVCPHEGAVLAADHVCGTRVKCSWHGLEFPARQLKPGGPPITICGARLEIREGTLHVIPGPGG